MKFPKTKIKSRFQNSLDANVKILVFGDCIKKFWKLQLGSVIALVTPPFASGDDKQSKIVFSFRFLFVISNFVIFNDSH